MKKTLRPKRDAQCAPDVRPGSLGLEAVFPTTARHQLGNGKEKNILGKDSSLHLVGWAVPTLIILFWRVYYNLDIMSDIKDVAGKKSERPSRSLQVSWEDIHRWKLGEKEQRGKWAGESIHRSLGDGLRLHSILSKERAERLRQREIKGREIKTKPPFLTFLSSDMTRALAG